MLVVRGSVRPLPGPSGDDAFDHGPPAVQEVAFVELQESVERPPYATGLGEEEREAVVAEAGATVTTAEAEPVPPALEA